MKKYLFSWLLSLVALWSFAQGDIPMKEDVVPPGPGFVRPFARDGGVDYRLPDGTIWKGRRIRDPKLNYIWPPYLIQNPVNGDQAIGPSATADTSQRQYAIYNGARWVEYGQPVPPVLTFGSAFSKAGTTVNLNQYPNTIGDIFADRLSVKEPVKATNPQQHSFILYNPAFGTFERIPYIDILSAFGVNQWPYSIGKIGVDALFWATAPNLVSAEGLNLSNAEFLMKLGNSTVVMNMGDYRAFLEKVLGSKSGKSLRRVAPVANQNAPGEVGDYFFHAGRMHLNIEKVSGQNAWIRWAPDTLFTYNIVPSSPAPVLTYTGNPTRTSISVSFTYAGSPTGFKLYASLNDTLSYQAVADIAAGARSYTLTNALPNSTYHLRLQALTATGTSPLSNRVVAVTQPEDNFTQWPNIRNVVITQSGPQQFKIEFDTYENGGGVRFEISKKANPNPSADPDYTFAAGKPLGDAGHYELFVDGITDSEVRNFRYRRESSSADGKTPSSYGTYGPVSIQGSGVTVNTPAITSTSDITQNSVKLNLNLNNTNVAKAWLYQSLASPQNFYRTEIPTNSTTYTVTGLAAGTKYQFHIQVSKMDGSTEIFSQNSTPETEVTTLGNSTTVGVPSLSNYTIYTVSESTPDQVGITRQNGDLSAPAQWEYRINNGAWKLGGTNENRNYFEPKNWARNTTIRYRARLSKGSIIGQYGNVLRVTFGANFRLNNNISDFAETSEPADQTPIDQVPPVTQPVQFNLSNITNTQATINVTNHVGGTKNYGWAVYRNAFNEPGSEFMGYFGGPIPSSGSFTVTIAGGEKTLVPGTTYRMYVNQSDNPDVTRAWVEFTVPNEVVIPPPVSTGTLKASAFSTSN